jgi:hypothetical protein
MPELAEVLARLGELPPGSLLIGVCKDHLPLLLDLRGREPRHFLICSDHIFANTLALKNMLTAALHLNAPEVINIHVIADNIKAYQQLIQTTQCKVSFGTQAPENDILLQEMFNLAVMHQRSHEDAGIHLMAIDGLNTFYKRLSPEGRSLFLWLLENCVEVGVWIFATLDTLHADRNLETVTKKFPARLLGQVDDIHLSRLLAGQDGPDLAHLIPGIEAIVISPN